MMDLATLEHVNRQATRRSAAAKRVPLIVDQRDLDAAKRGDYSGVRMPYVGSRTPRGWRRVNVVKWFSPDCGEDYRGLVQRGVYTDSNGKGAFFVDKSGFGRSGEPALTLGEFINLMRPGYGYAVVEDGPFQVHVGVFERAGKVRPAATTDHYHPEVRQAARDAAKSLQPGRVIGKRR